MCPVRFAFAWEPLLGYLILAATGLALAMSLWKRNLTPWAGHAGLLALALVLGGLRDVGALDPMVRVAWMPPWCHPVTVSVPLTGLAPVLLALGGLACLVHMLMYWHRDPMRVVKVNTLALAGLLLYDLFRGR